MSTDPHASLREDVKILGALLGDTLRQQVGENIYQIVEKVRSLSKKARTGDIESFTELEKILASLPIDDAHHVARAFANFLNLANIAEQHHRVRRSIQYKMDTSNPPQRGSCEETFGTLLESGISPQTLYEKICSQRVELVLTAHPTEITRRTLLQKYHRISNILKFRDSNNLTEYGKQETIRQLFSEITACWQTDEIRREKPTPIDEARGGLYTFEQTLWHVVPQFYRHLDYVLYKYTKQNLPLEAIPISFGSWMGGDRDGNPNVTAAVTRKVCRIARWIAADLYLREIDILHEELSMANCTAELRSVVGETSEPYRKLLKGIKLRLEHTREYLGDLISEEVPTVYDDVYLDARELEKSLQMCFTSLNETGASVVAHGNLLDVLRRLRCFGLTMVKLDLRQESDRHTEALDAITKYLGLGSYLEWDEEQRQKFLIAELNSKRPLIPKNFQASENVREVLDTFTAAAQLPSDSFGAYVISMASKPSDVLAVELFKKEAGIQDCLRVVPLFETVEDLKIAGDTLRRLLSVDWYREHIQGKQEVMIGYSDSAKTAGRLCAAWELYKAQEDIVKVCDEFKVHPTLFHGRGGTVGRGGGPTYLAILSQPPGSIKGDLRVTEQGEMIRAKFATEGIAMRTLELYTTATLKATLSPPNSPSQKWRDVMDQVANFAKGSYREVIQEDPQFVPYFRTATPEVELGILNIGSRPKRRSNKQGVSSLRAIPWVFAWTQTRLLLPSWLGVGESLQKAFESGYQEELQQMYENWPFFSSTLNLIQMVIAKSDIKIAEQYDRLLVPEELRGLGESLRQRHQLTEKYILEITKCEKLLEHNPVLSRSIEVRNPYVDPINLLQVEILKRLRSGDQEDKVLQDALLITMNGIAAGMRNTG